DVFGRRRIAVRVRRPGPDALFLDGQDRARGGLGGADGPDAGRVGGDVLFLLGQHVLGDDVVGRRRVRVGRQRGVGRVRGVLIPVGVGRGGVGRLLRGPASCDTRS